MGCGVWGVGCGVWGLSVGVVGDVWVSVNWIGRGANKNKQKYELNR